YQQTWRLTLLALCMAARDAALLLGPFDSRTKCNTLGDAEDGHFPAVDVVLWVSGLLAWVSSPVASDGRLSTANRAARGCCTSSVNPPSSISRTNGDCFAATWMS